MMRKLALVFAHPDDESYSAYGTVARHAHDPDFRLVVLHATDGEAGEIAPGVPATREGLGSWRRQEDENAWCALGRLPDRHDWLGYADGGVLEVGLETLCERVASFLRAERPDVVATFGPDGVTGHPDHIAVGQATTMAFHRVRGEGGPRLSRLVYGAIPLSRFERGQRWLAERGWPVWDPTRLYHLRGTPDELFGVISDNRSVLPLMLAAIKEHRSQRNVMFHPDGTDEDWSAVMRRESWVIAWPCRPAGAPMLDDLFAGLECGAVQDGRAHAPSRTRSR
jgi:LmbE family N-acetylglucosaminyl deacetylase